MPHGFGNSVECQSHCNTCSYYHGEPGEVGLVWVAVAELDVCLLGELEVYQEEYPYLLSAHLGPCHVDRHLVLRLGKECFELVRIRVAHDHETPDENGAREEDHRVDLHLEESRAALQPTLLRGVFKCFEI